jgi:signal peptidase II
MRPEARRFLNMTGVPVSRYWCFGVLVLAGVASDLISKARVFAELGAPERSSGWLWRSNFLWGRFEFRLTTVFNQGALFGIGQGFSWLFAGLSVVAAGGIIYWLFVRGEARSLWLTVTLGLVLAGALGNLFDRLHLHGWTKPDGSPQYGVRDFLDCTIPGIGFEGALRPKLVREYHWPVFNLADMYLVTGAIMLTLYSLVTPQRKDQPAAAGPPAAKETTPAAAVPPT